MLERGYADTGVQDLLDATKVPKGSFYHHFKNKEDFALQVIDRYMDAVHAALDAILADSSRLRWTGRARSSRRYARGTPRTVTWVASWAS